MARIRPFRGFRYHPDFTRQIESLTSPLFDVVTDKQLEQLYQNPNNSIHLSVPRRNSLPTPGQIVERWKSEEVIKLDMIPGIYVYYQHFRIPGEARSLTRKGFICLVEATDWGRGPIMRHESTMPDAVKDRLLTLRETQMQVNPTHGLYRDEHFELEGLMDEAMLAPLYEVEDYQGVRDTLALIQDREAVLRFMEVLADKTIVLADGHHRYEAAMALRKERRSNTAHPNGYEPWNWHMMYLTNEISPDLRIMATHRLLSGIGNWPKEEWMKRLEVFFTIREVEDPSDLPEIISGKKHAFGLVLPDGAFKIRLKPGMVEQIDWHFDDVVKNLDLTVLHYFIIWRILGIEGPAQRKWPHLGYERNFHRCLQKIDNKQAQALIVVNEVEVDDVRRVATIGQTMPPKSTYFYPKVLAGQVFASLVDEEFYSHADSSLGIAAPVPLAF